jgi:hypothetical protein
VVLSGIILLAGGGGLALGFWHFGEARNAWIFAFGFALPGAALLATALFMKSEPPAG